MYEYYGPFSYDVIAKDECSETGFIRETGLGFANSFTDAMSLLDKCYDIIEVKSLILLEPTNLILMPPDIIEKYQNDQLYNGASHNCDVRGNISVS